MHGDDARPSDFHAENVKKDFSKLVEDSVGALNPDVNNVVIK